MEKIFLNEGHKLKKYIIVISRNLFNVTNAKFMFLCIKTFIYFIQWKIWRMMSFLSWAMMKFVFCWKIIKHFSWILFVSSALKRRKWYKNISYVLNLEEEIEFDFTDDSITENYLLKNTRKKLLELVWEMMPHPPYSPDLATFDYHLFRSLQNYLKGKTFDSNEAVKNELI